VDALRLAALSQFESLAAFALHAGDAHHTKPATRDPLIGETYWPTGHLVALDLKSQSLFPSVLADLTERKRSMMSGRSSTKA
jgi:hypothetical protein